VHHLFDTHTRFGSILMGALTGLLIAGMIKLSKRRTS